MESKNDRTANKKRSMRDLQKTVSSSWSSIRPWKRGACSQIVGWGYFSAMMFKPVKWNISGIRASGKKRAAGEALSIQETGFKQKHWRRVTFHQKRWKYWNSNKRSQRKATRKKISCLIDPFFAIPYVFVFRLKAVLEVAQSYNNVIWAVTWKEFQHCRKQLRHFTLGFKPNEVF